MLETPALEIKNKDLPKSHERQFSNHKIPKIDLKRINKPTEKKPKEDDIIIDDDDLAIESLHSDKLPTPKPQKDSNQKKQRIIISKDIAEKVKKDWEDEWK